MTRNAGIFGRLTKAATADLPDMLDELTDGKGDGCIAVERTRLEGVADHVDDPRQSRRARPRPPALSRPGTGGLHAGRAEMARRRTEKEIGRSGPVARSCQ